MHSPVDPSAPMVLIVDDDPESLLLVGTMIEYVGYRPVVAANYAEASALLSAGPAALVLDLVTPDRATERLLADLQTQASQLPVVLMSAALRDRLGSEAAALARRGINVVSTLAKPFWVDALVGALESAIPDAQTPVIAAG